MPRLKSPTCPSTRICIPTATRCGKTLSGHQSSTWAHRSTTTSSSRLRTSCLSICCPCSTGLRPTPAIRLRTIGCAVPTLKTARRLATTSPTTVRLISTPSSTWRNCTTTYRSSRRPTSVSVATVRAAIPSSRVPRTIVRRHATKSYADSCPRTSGLTRRR